MPLWSDDDNLAELRPSLRDFVTCGPCHPHDPPTNYKPLLNLNKLLGLL